MKTKPSISVCISVWLAAASALGQATNNATIDQSYTLTNHIAYSNVDDQELLLDAYIPSADGKYPAVLVIHGGAWRFGDRKQLSSYARSLAERGFSCFAIDYRLAPKHKFPAQIEDCRAAVKWIRKSASKYKVDASKLGVIGYSAGGHLATLLGTTGEEPHEQNGNFDMRVQAVVAGGAPTDFRWMPDKGKWAKYWMGGDLDSVPEKFRLASSAAFVDAKDPPTFFFHGTRDTLVPPAWAGACHIALEEAGVKTVMHSIRGADHIQAAKDEDALKKAFEFLVTELQADPKPELKVESKPRTSDNPTTPSGKL